MTNVIRYKEDSLPVLLFISLFLVDLAVYAAADDWRLVATWAIQGIIPKGFISAWNHHHLHCYTFSSPILNRLLELVYFFQTGACGYGWELHHVVGHHAHYLDQKADPSSW